MTGIRFIRDESDEKTAAVIDLKTHKGTLGRHGGCAGVAVAADGAWVPLAKIKTGLIASGELRG